MVISIIVQSVSPGKGVRPLGVVVALDVNVRQGWMQPDLGGEVLAVVQRATKMS